MNPGTKFKNRTDQKNNAKFGSKTKKSYIVILVTAVSYDVRHACDAEDLSTLLLEGFPSLEEVALTGNNEGKLVIFCT